MVYKYTDSNCDVVEAVDGTVVLADFNAPPTLSNESLLPTEEPYQFCVNADGDDIF